MSAFDVIDLSALPAPTVIEEIDYEALLAEMMSALLALAPELAEPLGVEGDPLNKLLQVFAYHRMLDRNRVNQAAKAVMLAFATGADLDHLGALFGVQRLVVTLGDDTAAPPVPAVLEDDARFRSRIQLSLEGFSTAGPVGAYVFHARSASAEVKDVHVFSPAPGEVRVVVLSTEGDGAPAPELLMAVDTALNADTVRPLCDTVSVAAPVIVTYAIDATLQIEDGPDASVVLAEARKAAEGYVAAAHRLGGKAARSGIFAALHRPGVVDVTLAAPAADVEPGPDAAAWCTAITVVQEVP